MVSQLLGLLIGLKAPVEYSPDQEQKTGDGKSLYSLEAHIGACRLSLESRLCLPPSIPSLLPATPLLSPHRDLSSGNPQIWRLELALATPSLCFAPLEATPLSEPPCPCQSGRRADWTK